MGLGPICFHISTRIIPILLYKHLLFTPELFPSTQHNIGLEVSITLIDQSKYFQLGFVYLLSQIFIHPFIYLFNTHLLIHSFIHLSLYPPNKYLLSPPLCQEVR